MAIYAEHNFTENYLNAIGGNDDHMQQEMVIDELGRLIVDNKREVVNMLRSNSVNVKINDVNDKLINILTKYINSDAGIRGQIIDMIKAKSVDFNFVNGFLKKQNKNEAPKKQKEPENTGWANANAWNTGFEEQPKKESSDPDIEENEDEHKRYWANITGAISSSDVQGSMKNSLDMLLQKMFSMTKDANNVSPYEKNTRILQERVKLNEMFMHADASPIVTPTKWTPKTTMIVAGLVVLGLAGIYVYIRFFKKPAISMETLPVPGVTPPTVGSVTNNPTA